MDSPRYDLHIHSTYSDGDASVREIASKAIKMQLDTIAIADHFWPCLGSRRAGAQLINQRREEILNLQKVFENLRIIDAAEIDIASDGSPAPVAGGIEQFDLVIGSIHFFLDSITWRSALQKALSQWHFDILGHWDGYLNSCREEDAEAVAALLSKNNVAIELSKRYETKFPWFIEMARDAGCEFTVGSDAHTIQEIGDLKERIQLADAMGLKLKQI
ncbi:MAG: PHP domain-containing protein [Candidatus Thorarchaeota archaeon]